MELSLTQLDRGWLLTERHLQHKEIEIRLDHTEYSFAINKNKKQTTNKQNKIKKKQKQTKKQ